MTLAMPLPRIRRVLWMAAALLVLFNVTGFLVLPPLVRSQLERRLSAALGRPVTVGRVRVNPYVRSATIERVEVRDKDGAAPVLRCDRLHADFALWASLRGEWVVSMVEVDGLRANIVVNLDGSLNVSDLLAGGSADGAPVAAHASRPWRVDAVRLTGGAIEVVDRTRPTPFHTTIELTRFSLTGFHTAGERPAPCQLEATIDSDERLTWQGWILVAPFRSGGDWKLENVQLKKYAPYFKDQILADVTDGVLSVQGHCEASGQGERPYLKVTEGVLQLRDFRMVERGTGQPVMALSALEVSGASVDVLARRATLKTVALTGGQIAIRRPKTGPLNLLALLPPAAPRSSVAASATVAQPEVAIGEITLKDCQIDFSDLSAPRPIQLALSGVQGSLKNFALGAKAPMPIQLSFRCAPQGTVAVNGTITLDPAVGADLQVEVHDLALPPLSPGLEQFIDVGVTHGAVSAQGQVRLASGIPGPAVTFAGDVRLEKLRLVDGIKSEELAGCSELSLTDLKVNTGPPLTLSLAEASVSGLYGRVILDRDNSLNLLVFVGPTPASVNPPPRISIKKLTIADGEITFNDRSLEPNVQLTLAQVGGTVTGLSDDDAAQLDLALQGKVDGVGPVAVTGKFGPRAEADLRVDLKGVDLPLLSPYYGKYAGYELARGKLQVVSAVRIVDRKLDSANRVTVDQFAFGAPIKSRETTALPVRLGVALLRDANDRIVIDLPVKGDLDDPDFHIGQVIGRALTNLLAKAAASPFALLASVFGGGGDLAYQEFAPGTTTLLPQEDKKIETLIKALTSRPELKLDIEGSYDAAVDTPVLQQQKFAQLVRLRIWEARRASEPNLPPVEELTITPEQHAGMVQRLFAEKLPATPEPTVAPSVAPAQAGAAPAANLEAPPPAKVEAPPAARPARRGFFRWLADLVTLKGLRKPTAAKRPAVNTNVAAPKVATVPLADMTARLVSTMAVDDNDLRALAAARARQVRDHFIQDGKIASDRLFLVQHAGAPGPERQKPCVYLTLL
jgi:uncharacterized protein involved in outer membrane biogenesis